MIKNLIFGVSLLIFWQKVSKSTKATKKKTKKNSFYNTNLLKTPHSFCKSQLAQLCKTMLPQHG